jgi:hypothetical protein
VLRIGTHPVHRIDERDSATGLVAQKPKDDKQWIAEELRTLADESQA